MNNCTFCRILTGELASSRVFEDDIVVALLDIGPINPGHTLVIPRRHVMAFTDLASSEVEGLARVAQRVASALKSCVPGCAGVTISLADGEAAGQEVPHAHLHVIPRHPDDGFGWRRFGRAEDRLQLDAMALRIRKLLDSTGVAG